MYIIYVKELILMYATCAYVAPAHTHTHTHTHTTEFTSTAIMHNTSLLSEHSNVTPNSIGNI